MLIKSLKNNESACVSWYEATHFPNERRTVDINFFPLTQVKNNTLRVSEGKLGGFQFKAGLCKNS
jgi:hypothetical protein